MMHADTLRSEMMAEMAREHERELENMRDAERDPEPMPAPACAECGCPDNTLGRRGMVCDCCNAPWPME